MPLEIWIALIPCISSLFISFIGIYVNSKTIELRLKEIEKTLDKQSEFIERIILVEASTKSAHKRIDNFQKKC